ncbi:hypothetical protein [Pluralibacter sp.]|uniref:hypothetical protein n=1 Tax=Pluralibacter sp. TaxID=1920032 RepID=UPI0025FDA201|nr:hypothetical protein [Pluralibacter sp.]MBV8044839.1 hypothetical protein [Pluralibacter sp.]
MHLKKNTFSRPLALLLALTCAAPAVAAGTNASFSDAQQAQIGPLAEAYFTAHPDKLGEAVATYLANHPEFLVAASENLRQRQQVAEQQAQVQMVLQHQAQLLSMDSPSVGPKDAKASVVMFFDSQGSNYSAMAPMVEQLVKANPDVRFIFKALAANQTLAQQMGFSRAPAFVVMPQSAPASAQRVYVASGSTTQEVLQMAIQKAKGQAGNTQK